MLNCFQRRPLYFNKNLREYCTKTTNESIKKISEKYNLERNNLKFKNPFKNEYDEDDEESNFNFYNFLLFLSITTISFYFYKRIK